MLVNNKVRAQKIVQYLIAWGVQEVVLCPGSRNAPLVFALEAESKIRIYSFFHEGSAAFFALGRIMRKKQPVAVCTTSGTAVSEMYSAVIEGYYNQLPLVVLTADRPHKLRYTGAPQAMPQNGLFGFFTPMQFDLASDLDPNQWPQMPDRMETPVHINIGFDEPLFWDDKDENDKSSFGRPTSEELAPQRETSGVRDPIAYLKDLENPAVIVGGLSSEEERLAVSYFLKDVPCPIYCEELSGLRQSGAVRSLCSEGRFIEALCLEKKVKSILRLGDVPVMKFWRQLEGLSIPVLNLPFRPFFGISRGNSVFVTFEYLNRYRRLAEIISPNSDLEVIYRKDKELRICLDNLIAQYPSSELGFFSLLRKVIGHQDTVYLGNSLPVREWELSGYGKASRSYFANRGMNGIDGQISTFFGALQKGEAGWGILGDLTTLYDMSGLWAARYTDSPWTLFIINNGGGKIFESLYNSTIFQNRHNLTFEPLARMWSLKYERIDDPDLLTRIDSGSQQILEIIPDQEASHQLANEIKKMFQKFFL